MTILKKHNFLEAGIEKPCRIMALLHVDKQPSFSENFWMQRPKYFRILVISWMFLVFWCLSQFVSTDHSLAKTDIGESRIIRVAVTGGDTAGCGAEGSPCRTIQYAVDTASSGDTILVAKGTYTYNASVGSCVAYIGSTGVVCILNKQLAIWGGYTATDWTYANPQLNGTIIDGQNTYRGVLVQRTGPSAPTTSLFMTGFTIQNCKAQGAAAGDDNQTYAFGGGMLTDASWITLKSMVFKNNMAIGGNTASAYGGAGSGGGLALRTAPGVTLEHVVFENNLAQGGIGPERGGFAIGGGLYTFQSIVTGHHITFTNNLAQAGNSSGAGISAWNKADAQGGGLGVQVGSNVALSYVNARGNRAVGGNAGTDAGGAFGGFGKVELASLSLSDSIIQQNEALGGDGVIGGLGIGGGVESINSDVTLDRVYLIANIARGGNGSSEAGAAGGGGAGMGRFQGATKVKIINSVIADNLVAMGATGALPGGGGGGLWVQGLETDIVHTTIARNRLNAAPLQGQAILVLRDGVPAAISSVANVDFSIIADHVEYPGSVAVHVKPGNVINFNRGLWAGNTKNTNSDGGPGPAGTFNGLESMLGAASVDFVSPGTPSYDYHILATSEARDAAVGSTLTIDIDGDRRSDGLPDIGADEYKPAIRLAANAVNASTLRLNWQLDVSQLPGLGHYRLVYSYEAGANPPGEGSSPINVGAVTTYQLTGLSAYKKYTLTIEAYDVTGRVLDTSNTVVTFPTDIFVFLPLVMR